MEHIFYHGMGPAIANKREKKDGWGTLWTKIC